MDMSQKPFIDVYIFQDGFHYRNTPIIPWRQDYLNSLDRCDVRDSTLVWRLLEKACRRSLRKELNELNPRRLNTKRIVVDGYHISLSHSGGYYMVAISSDPIGVDLQKVREGAQVNYNDEIWSDGEKKFVTKNNPHNYLYWSRKEALYKYLDPGVEYGKETYKQFDTTAEPTPSYTCSGSINFEDAYWSVVSPLIKEGVIPTIILWPSNLECREEL